MDTITKACTAGFLVCAAAVAVKTHAEPVSTALDVRDTHYSEYTLIDGKWCYRRTVDLSQITLQ
jgi:hypothetical protein